MGINRKDNNTKRKEGSNEDDDKVLKFLVLARLLPGLPLTRGKKLDVWPIFSHLWMLLGSLFYTKTLHLHGHMGRDGKGKAALELASHKLSTINHQQLSQSLGPSTEK